MKANGNCKKVRCITNGNLYCSVSEAAKANGVSVPSMSYAITHKTKSKGNEYRFEHDMYRFIPKIAERLSEVTEENATLKAKAEAWDAYQAELEAQRKAEEKRLEEEAKAKAKHDAAVAKQEAKVAKLEAKHNRKSEAITKAERALRKAKDEECNAWLELCTAIDELNELNASETVEWEVM